MGDRCLECRVKVLILSWSWRTSECKESSSTAVEDAGGPYTAATGGMETSMPSIILSAISARLSRVMLAPEAAKTMRTLAGSGCVVGRGQYQISNFCGNVRRES